MSGTITWNSKEVQAFKKAFGSRSNFKWPFGSEPVYDPNIGNKKAGDMLRERQRLARQTLAEVLKQQEPVLGANNAMLVGLKKMETDLSAKTIRDAARGILPGRDIAEDPNIATQRIIELTDEWIAFEARCISANNEISAGTSDAAVREKLARRTNGLSETLGSIKRAGATDNFSELENTIATLVAEAANDGTAIADLAAFAKRIDDCTKTLRGVAASASDVLEVQLGRGAEPVLGDTDSHEKWVKLQETQLKQLYGIEAKTTPTFGLPPSNFPYRDLLDVLAMVPSDHSLTTALTTITREFTSLSDGGDYDQTKTTIRLNPLMEWLPINEWLPAIKLPLLGTDGLYQDPETKKQIRLNAWKATALHEIGHAVDAAYQIMSSHGGKSGCGIWTERDPAEFMPQETTQFADAMKKASIGDSTFIANRAAPRFVTIAAIVAAGTIKLDDAKKKISALWTELWEQNDAHQFESGLEAVKRINATLTKAFPANRQAGKPDDARASFLATGIADDVKVVTNQMKIVTAEEFWSRFERLVTDPIAKVSEMQKWLQTKGNERWVDLVGALGEPEKDAKKDKDSKVTRWTDATVEALPKPADPKLMAKYRADAQPWNGDISSEKINDLPAAHEAYAGDEKWWQYSAQDRSGTFVSNYQWRAPGEWFAELYAVTWFKKVEPPGGVANAVRPYLYGGHITPDQAV